MLRELTVVGIFLLLLIGSFFGVRYYVDHLYSVPDEPIIDLAGHRVQPHYTSEQTLRLDPVVQEMEEEASPRQAVQKVSQSVKPVQPKELPAVETSNYPPDTEMSRRLTDQRTPRPGLMESTIDQAFGTKIRRITDKLSQNVRQFLVARVQFWNSNSSRIRIDYKIYDTQTNAHLGTLDTLLHEIKWSRLQPNILYGMHHNYRNSRMSPVNPDNDFIFFRIDSDAGLKMEPLITFPRSQYREVHIGPWEGNIDYHDRYVVFAAKKRHSDKLVAIVYDIQKKQQIAMKAFDDVVWSDDRKLNQHDWISVSPNGNYIAHAKRDATSDYSWGSYYIDMYDLHLNKIRKLSDTSEHGDLCVTEDGQDIYVQYRGPHREFGIWFFDLATGNAKPVLQQGKETYGGGHISCQNFKRPGWCYVSTKGKGYQEVFALKLDGSQTVNRFGQTHGTTDVVESSKGTPNPDGTQVLFQSTWGVLNRSEAYIAEANK